MKILQPTGEPLDKSEYVRARAFLDANPLVGVAFDEACRLITEARLSIRVVGLEYGLHASLVACRVNVSLDRGPERGVDGLPCAVPSGGIIVGIHGIY